MDQTHQ